MILASLLGERSEPSYSCLRTNFLIRRTIRRLSAHALILRASYYCAEFFLHPLSVQLAFELAPKEIDSSAEDSVLRRREKARERRAHESAEERETRLFRS